MNTLYGPKHIEKQRSSGYKSTVYALAEIVDNSIDAGASKVEIHFCEKTINAQSGAQRKRMSQILVTDNGCGMSPDMLNGCLTFAEGSGSEHGRIGTFGFGLPNSSISVCRRVEVYSRTSQSDWHIVYLDIDEILASASEYKAARQLPTEPDLGINLDQINTVIRWTTLDKCDAAQAKTLIRRSDKLLGRLYRYFLSEQKVDLQLISRNLDNEHEDSRQTVIPNDPLFLEKGRYHMTDLIWQEATRTDGKDKHPILGDEDPYFNPVTHYKRFILGCTQNKSQLPLFQPCKEFWDVKYDVSIGSSKYRYTIKAAFATSGIANPGLRSGGGTEIGRKIGEKMNGTKDCRSDNIFWIREGRELDFGSWGLYNRGQEKNRFWTIEIHFDHTLDEILGVSNTKQSVDFHRVDGNLDELDSLASSLTVQEERQVLFHHITQQCLSCIKHMNSQLKSYASEFSSREMVAKGQDKNKNRPIPEVEGTVFRSLPKSGEWSSAQKTEVVNFLKERYPTIEIKAIKNQIDIAAKGLTSTVVLYAPNETGNMFDIEPARGKFITIINSRHSFYERILAPIKKHTNLVDFTVSMEMLISAMAIQKHEVEVAETDSEILNFYLQGVSSRLQLWIRQNNIQIDSDRFAKNEEVEE